MQNNLNQLKNYITSGQCVTVNGMPGVGISLFLKEVCTQKYAEFHYIDVFGLAEKTTSGLIDKIAQSLGINDSHPRTLDSIQKNLEGKNFLKPLVFAFAGFDKLEKNFTKEFYDKLRAIRSIDRKNIIFLFGVCKRLETIIPEQVKDSEISMLSTKFYLKPYSSQAAKSLLKKYGPHTNDEDTKIDLSGGHFQLLQLLIQTEYPLSPLSDQFIELCFKNILSHLSSSQKKEIYKIAQKKISEISDPYLLHIGVVGGDGELFSPLFRDFLIEIHPKRIPAKEGILFRLLKSRSGKIVDKDEIIKIVWKENSDTVTNWALDSLIYRLRKNDIFKKSGFEIESVKKIGYRLVKNS